MSDNSNTKFAEESHPPIVLKFQDGDVQDVDTTPLDALGDSEDDAPILEVEYGSGTDSDDGVIHRYNVILREGTADTTRDLQRSWGSDDGVTDDSEMNVSMDERSWDN